MNTHMTARILSAVLALLLLSTAGCAEKNATASPDSTAQNAAISTEAETEMKPDIPEETFDGKSFVFMNTFCEDTKYTNRDIYPEGLNGDSLNDALYNRCIKMETQYDITIVDADANLNQVKNSISAADSTFDVTFATLSDIMSCVTAGYAVDLHTVPYINLTAPWWDNNATEKLSFSGKLYYTFNDIIFTQLDNCRAFYFNKDMIVNYNLEDPYKIVNDYKWTIDKMTEMGLVVVDDIDGDGKMTETDQYGVMSWGVTGLYEALLTGADVEIMKQGEDGIPYFYCTTERFADVYTKILDTMGQNNIFYIGQSDKFMNDGVLFNCNSLVNAVSQRTMETDFGILPVPMYSEDQGQYLNVSPNAHAIFVPVTVSDMDFCGIILEAMAYESSKTVIPAYYDILLKGKSTRDNESEEMLDVIHDSVSYVIKIIGVSFSDALFTQMGKNNYDISSFVEKNRNNIEEQLANVIEQYG